MRVIWGWAKSIAALKAKEFVTDKEEYEKHQREYENAEKKLMTDGASHNLGPNKVWLELEKLRARWLWRPLRDLETNVIHIFDSFASSFCISLFFKKTYYMLFSISMWLVSSGM